VKLREWAISSHRDNLINNVSDRKEADCAHEKIFLPWREAHICCIFFNVFFCKRSYKKKRLLLSAMHSACK